jgi:hypothetical protein
MTDALAATLEQTILAHRPLDIDVNWADEIVFPHYDGLSIRNLAHTVLRLFDIPDRSGDRMGDTPLDARLWQHHQGDVRRVVLFISDGLGWRLLQDLIAEDDDIAQTVADLTGDGQLVPITSIAPSTTAAALPSIWTGAGPAATGMLGTQLFLREINTLVSLLHFSPVAGRHRPEVLEEWGLDFETFLPLTTLGEALATRGIPTHLLLQKDLYGSGLSRLMHRNVKHLVRHYGYNDLWIALRDLLHATRRQRCFVTIYWGAVDGISHLHGTTAEHVIAEIRRQLAALRDVLHDAQHGDGRTLFVLAADHGHSPIPNYINLADHPPIIDALRGRAGGESRFAHVYLRHDFRPQVVDYIRAHLADQLAVVHPRAALDAGLFGSDGVHLETPARLGDLTVIAREGSALGDGPLRRFASVSRHGGLSAREMLVPLLLRVL